MKLEGRFWITHNGKNLAGQGRIELLARIADSGSISQAAKAMGMSYKSAWDAVDAMNKTAGEPLVERSVGGKGGGGTRLTAAGKALIETFRRHQREHRGFLDSLGEAPDTPPALRTSARNQLPVRVLAIHPGDLCDRVEVGLADGQRLQVSITQGSTEALALCEGSELVALVKAPWVRLADSAGEEGNRLRGRLLTVRRGERHSELLVGLDDAVQLTALVANGAVDGLSPQEGQTLELCIDPEQIILCR
ncbi:MULTISPECIES: TOBE domain-containing protein [unclassified Pseudomonas]|uniref:TOBE domain-containing protein n=1 Tax=unclassified Pseudomonas TaxID=196821 RepID=UPI002448E379|nr:MULTISPECIES: TOBE domain-containing protein [unclassified Pseudomonas]MDG9925326.1 TOBE domain-containing protein [Pseudomonas sp. GD04045]MDH0036019.1 TOBE domain-containing protein [Pseudomonas sp. GD04019]